MAVSTNIAPALAYEALVELRHGGRNYKVGSTIRLIESASKSLLSKKAIAPAAFTSYEVKRNLRHAGRHYSPGMHVNLTAFEVKDLAPFDVIGAEVHDEITTSEAE